MNKKRMNFKYTFLPALFILTSLIVAAAVHAEDKFKLKEGAKAKICTDCHEDIQEVLKSPFVHTPVKLGECSGCHDPHTSDHGKLLDDNISRLCFNCHKQIIPENAQSIHKIVNEGNCISCHDPHASNNKFILIKKGNSLCFECHGDLDDLVNKAEYRHEPVEKDAGCLNCHDPHASAEFNFVLKKDAPSLCTECHKTSERNFAKRHMDYPVADSRCTSCHNAHGSNKKGIVYNDVHEPVARKECDKCHDGPGTASPLATKQDGTELCRECHKDVVRGIFAKNRVHTPLFDKTGCLNCHNPHASPQKNLLSGTIIKICGNCHKDTVALQQISIENPENKNICKPVKEGNCIDCHSPHSSDSVLLIAEDSISFGTCDKCHEWQTHSSHPIGEGIVDPRNQNLRVDCLSCHIACGTGNKASMMPFANTYALCIQCHSEYRK